MSNHDRKGPPPRDEGAMETAAQDTARDTVQYSALKHAWQQASDEQPPPELDASIIAAARKSVQDRNADSRAIHASPKSGPTPKSRHWWTQWQPLAAAATVAGLAFVLVQLLPRDRDVAPSIRMEESVPAQTAKELPAQTAAETETQDNQSQGAAIPAPGAAAPKVSIPQTTAEAPAQAPAESSQADTAAAARAAASASEMDATARADGAVSMDAAETGQRKAVSSEMAGGAASAAAPAPALERSLGNAAPPGAADRAAGIVTLYASGDVTGAADALRVFRAADPDADTYLPDSLRSWARTVK